MSEHDDRCPNRGSRDDDLCLGPNSVVASNGTFADGVRRLIESKGEWFRTSAQLRCAPLPRRTAS